jgi:hypothetical protein
MPNYEVTICGGTFDVEAEDEAGAAEEAACIAACDAVIKLIEDEPEPDGEEK